MHSLFTDRMPFMPPNEQRQSTEKFAAEDPARRGITAVVLYTEDDHQTDVYQVKLIHTATPYTRTFAFSSLQHVKGGSAAEWLACWTQAQKDSGSNRSRDAVG